MFSPSYTQSSLINPICEQTSLEILPLGSHNFCFQESWNCKRMGAYRLQIAYNVDIFYKAMVYKRQCNENKQIVPPYLCRKSCCSVPVLLAVEVQPQGQRLDAFHSPCRDLHFTAWLSSKVMSLQLKPPYITVRRMSIQVSLTHCMLTVSGSCSRSVFSSWNW